MPALWTLDTETESGSLGLDTDESLYPGYGYKQGLPAVWTLDTDAGGNGASLDPGYGYRQGQHLSGSWILCASDPLTQSPRTGRRYPPSNRIAAPPDPDRIPATKPQATTILQYLAAANSTVLLARRGGLSMCCLFRTISSGPWVK